MKISITETDQSRISEVDFNHLQFGRIFSDHMLEMVYKDGQWHEPKIIPYGPIQFTPSMQALHYGQAIFEGMKAYHVDDETLHLFRPKDHHQRLNNSARRLCMPEIDEQIFIEGLEELISLDHQWVPKQHGHALYVRPFMFAAEEYLAAKVSKEYRFYVITSPVAAYYSEGFNPVKLTTSEKFVRAVEGGTGEAKAAGNYAASFLPAQNAQKKGFTQVIWLDAKEKRFIEEVGTMNIFFQIDEKLVTPKLSGSVLPGITRRSVIEIAKNWGTVVEERRVGIDEIIEAHKSGRLKEVFGSGTAAVISPVGVIQHGDETIRLDEEKIGPFAKKMFATITGIQYGKIDDPFGWTHPISLD
ncbi:branched-chain amino acid aminotransferase [Rhodohalobacter barkolensis]|uniref:Branched-chain-amino-acid aminotransferase n=1 Tax=Rhodohalobacter barkolensis TaxID=2053187 RepID=A0A2N0VG22_9BACT|nr:branched-chain amino acid aminotransferase [Rhodohalobacter barkolensis]PKD43136.1 branched chain amino acid aminotransferase [Rhodohalobacter barkolensis]